MKSHASLYRSFKYAIINRFLSFVFADLATKMHELEKAFKKFEVETEECQMFVACEAAQYKKLAQNVPVVQIVSQILRWENTMLLLQWVSAFSQSLKYSF